MRQSRRVGNGLAIVTDASKQTEITWDESEGGKKVSIDDGV